MPNEAEDRAHKIAQARAALHQGYTVAVQALTGKLETTARDIANLDLLDQIVIDYMVEISASNAVDQTAPRTIATRAHVEGMARAEAVRVVDHHDETLRGLLKDIREAAADLGRQAREVEPITIGGSSSGAHDIRVCGPSSAVDGPAEPNATAHSDLSEAAATPMAEGGKP